ncbi:MAG: protein kinase [Chloroflexota bacterium]
MTALSLYLLGPFRAELEGELLTDFRTRKVQALLIYLAAERQAHKRDLLLELLWPGLPERSARSNLRQIIYYLRQLLPDAPNNGQPLIIVNRQDIQLNPQADVTVDLAQFQALLDQSQAHDHLDLFLCADCRRHLEQAVALYRGDFLVDFYLDDSNEFEEWAYTRRAYFRRRALDALAILTTMATRRQDYAQAQTFARQQLAIDNLREGAYRQLMAALALNGRRQEALAVYESCRRLLAAELSMAPAARTTDFYEKIRAGDLRFDTIPSQGVRGYELQEQIGEGGYGTIHRARQPVIGREVAIKIIRQKYANDPDFIRRFEAEAQIVARLEHPYIVPLYDYWRDPEGAYLVMRYMRQGSLLTALQAGPWPPERAVSLLEQVAGALAVAHQRGVVHRDIKPGNILLDEAGNAYLADFGIAKDLTREEPLTVAGTVIGTLDYVSPEQILGEAVTPQTDIYSLGAVLYETLTGEKPFSGAIANLLQSHLHEPLPPVTASLPHVPVAIDAVLQKATDKTPANRYAGVLALAEAFGRAVRGQQPDLVGELRPTRPALAEIYNPYKGLRAFQEADANDFFGRDALVQQLLDRLDGAAVGRDGRFLAVIGPSGSGKSSVVKAGLLPALRDGALPGSENWFVAEMTPGRRPFESLELALWSVAVEPPPNLVEPMRRDANGLLRTIRRILPDTAGGQLLLLVDQFEELFTLVEEEEERTFFLDSLLTAINAPRSPLRLVVTLRADFYDRPLQRQQLGQLLKENTEIVLPLNATELTWAIREPARRMGVGLEEGLAAAIAADVADQPGALPLLQYALTELFEQRQNQHITRAAYEEIGGVQGALGRRAETLYKELDEHGQAVARQLFLRLVTLGEGAEDTRRRVLLSELKALDTPPIPAAQAETDEGSSRITHHASRITAVLDRFGAARFLTFDRDPLSRSPTVEVAHEALLSQWPRLRGWLADSRHDVRWQRLLATATAEWQGAGEETGYLLRGGRLDQFEQWSASSSVALTSEEQAFLAASLTARSARRAEEEDRRQRELETAQKLAQTERRRAEEQAQSAQRLRQRAAFLAGALAVAALLAILAFTFARSASHNAELAAAREVDALTNAELAATRAAEAVTSAGLAATREVEAINSAGLATARQAEAEAEANLRATAEAIAIEEREATEQQRALAEEQVRLATSRELALAALNTLDRDPELSILLALQAIETAYTQAAEDALHRAVQQSRLRQALPGVKRAVYHPNGVLLATVSETKLQIWDLATNQSVLTVTLPAEPRGVAFSPDGRTIATGHEGGAVILWDAASGAEQRQLVGHTGLVYSLVFSSDGQRLASSGAEGVAILWDLDSGEPLFTFPGVVLWSHQIAFSPDGALLAVPELGEGEAASEGVMNLWDTTSGARQLTVGPGMGAFEFSPDGAYLATGAAGNRTIIWDLAASLAAGTGQPAATLTGHTNAVFDGVFSPDGSLIATTSADGTARVWDPRTGQEWFKLAGHTGDVWGPIFSPDGRRLLTIARDGVRIWDVSIPGNEEVMVLAGPGGAGYTPTALSSDGLYLALGSVSGLTHLHDAATGELLAVLSGHSRGIRRLAFSPDGQQLATASHDGTVRVWDVAASLVAGQGQTLLTLDAHEADAVIGGTFSGVVGLDYSPDGTRLATSGADGLIRFWDVVNGELLATVADYPGDAGVWSVVFSPDGHYLAASFEIRGDERLVMVVKVWRLSGDDLEELYTLTDFPGRIHNLRFSPDNRYLLTSGGAGHLALWDAGSGELVRSLSGHTSTVIRATFSLDGKVVASSSGGDASVRLWDVASGDNLLILTTDVAQAESAFSPDGTTLYASNQAGELRVYAVQLEALVSLAHARLTRSLTAEECRQYLHLADCPAGQ